MSLFLSSGINILSLNNPPLNSDILLVVILFNTKFSLFVISTFSIGSDETSIFFTK